MITKNQSEQICSNLYKTLGPNGRAGMKRRFNFSKPIEVYPGIFSDDPRYLCFLKDLYNSVSNWRPTAIDEAGFFVEDPITDESSRLRTMPGSIRFPLSFGRIRRTVDIKPSHLSILDKLIKVIMSKKTTYSGFLRNDSNFGFPSFDIELSKKYEKLNHVIKNINIFKQLHVERKPGFRRHAFNLLGLMMLSNTQIRLQSDLWINGKPKSREITPFDAQYLGAQSSIRISDMYDSFFAKSRTRVVCAMPGLYNAILNTASARFKDGMFKSFEPTYITRGLSDLERKAKLFDKILGVDVKNFDSNKPENLIIERIKRYPVTELGANLIKDMYYCPWFCSDPDGKGNWAISGDPFADQFDTWKGTPSGLWETSFGNNIDATFLFLVEMSYYIPNIEDSIEDILLHKHDVGACIVGDDQLHMFRGKYTYIYEEILRNGYRNEYLNLEREEGISFLGMTLYKDADGHVKASNNIMSYFIRSAIPEKSANTHFRKFPFHGVLDRKNNYVSSHIERATLTWNELWRKHFSFSWDSFVQDHYLKEVAMLRSEVNERDAYFLSNPDAIHYKLSREDVSDDVFKQVYQTFPQNMSDLFYGLIYK